MNEVLDFLNLRVREMHGNRLQLEDLWSKSALDTFGTVWVFARLHEEYGVFSSEWLDSVNLNKLTVLEIISKVI